MSGRREARLVEADRLAITAHAHAEATSGYRFLAQQIWHTVQALGAPPGGQVLVAGQGSTVFVGATPQGVPEAASLWDGPVPWRATIPPRWPYPAFTVDPTPEPAGTSARGPFAVQVISQVGLDVHLRSTYAWSRQQLRFHEHLTQALAGTSPGGLVVALANHSILDNATVNDPTQAGSGTDSSGQDGSGHGNWDRVNRVADFLGAARLPSNALRADARCDAPFDLLIFRRRSPGSPGPQAGLVVPGARWMPGTGMAVSSYYQKPHDGHVLGLPVPRTDRWDMEQLAVLDRDQTWRHRLPRVLDQIARTHATTTRPGTGLDTPGKGTPDRGTPGGTGPVTARVTPGPTAPTRPEPGPTERPSQTADLTVPPL